MSACELSSRRVELTVSNILREDWKPVLNLSSVCYGLQLLFLAPNPDDPLNKGECAGQRVRGRNCAPASCDVAGLS